ncbi:MAG: UDP-N-acetylmuramate dehydrogenase [Coriobacteriia bacterium]|nr:UDP-N-acetylmuramate dehydrogenase [Coriobacteriia bacterium]
MDQASSLLLADKTSFHIGGKAQAFVKTEDRDEFYLRAKEADKKGLPLFVLGGGSNVLVSDEGFDGLVLQDGREELEIRSNISRDYVEVKVSAGYEWDSFVAWTIDHGLSGLAALSGIPGSTGASPVQNIGAYGYEVASYITQVHAYDRFLQEEVVLKPEDLAFAYRSSAIKQSIQDAQASDPVILGPTGRWIVLDVVYTLEKSPLAEGIKYAELARELGVEQGKRIDSYKVREQVLKLRSQKGMRYMPEDRDCWSAGSFFTNPVLSAEEEKQLDPEAPRYPYKEGFKTSAAWLIDHAGFHKGFKLDDSGAQLSTKHVLALCNHKNARAQDVLHLAHHIQNGVMKRYGIKLHMEPVKVGF